MKIRKNIFDDIVYVIFCIATFGLVFILRVTITIAIKKAMEE